MQASQSDLATWFADSFHQVLCYSEMYEKWFIKATIILKDDKWVIAENAEWKQFSKLQMQELVRIASTRLMRRHNGHGSDANDPLAKVVSRC
jgi:hypothetical protein